MSNQAERKVTITVTYPAGHSYETTFVECDEFCPNCGERKLWVEAGEGDYYLGPTFTCVACGGDYHISGSGPPGQPHMKKRLADLRAAAEECK